MTHPADRPRRLAALTDDERIGGHRPEPPPTPPNRLPERDLLSPRERALAEHYRECWPWLMW